MVIPGARCWSEGCSGDTAFPGRALAGVRQVVNNIKVATPPSARPRP